MAHDAKAGGLGSDKCKPWKHVWEFEVDLTPKGRHAKPSEKKKFTWREKCKNCDARRRKSGDTLKIGKGPGK